MLKMQRVRTRQDIPDNWRERLVVLWSEDDARPVDRERGTEAFERIAGFNADAKRETHHIHTAHEYGDDVFTYFYRGGWVFRSTCEGTQVGVLVEGPFN